MPAVTMGMALVFALIVIALVLLVTEAIPSDVTAIGVLVSLALLEPWTGVRATEAIQGFASAATITILAMYILSEGVQHTGIVERLEVARADSLRATSDGSSPPPSAPRAWPRESSTTPPSSPCSSR